MAVTVDTRPVRRSVTLSDSSGWRYEAAPGAGVGEGWGQSPCWSGAQ